MRVVVLGGSGFIGFHVCEALASNGHDVVVLDVLPMPKILTALFIQCDATKGKDLIQALELANPDVVINLVARTDDEGSSLLDYQTNFSSVSNLLTALSRPCLEGVHLIHVSTQFVVGPDAPVSGELPDQPYTTYGMSKAIAEKMIRDSALSSWAIVRPSAVWGPNHPSFAFALFPLMERGLLCLPSKPVLRSYVHVVDVAQQLVTLVELGSKITSKRTLYIGEDPRDQGELLDLFAIGLTGRRVRRVPRWILWILSLPSHLPWLSRRWPLTRTRYEILCTDYLIDTSESKELVGGCTAETERCVQAIVEWYRETQLGVAGCSQG